MKSLLCLLGVFIVAALLAGCAARSKTRLATDEGEPPRTGPVCLLRLPLPDDVSVKPLGYINASRRSYGSMSGVLNVMANDARKLGADAIIEVKTKVRPNMWSWARPIAEGTAVKILSEDFDCLRNGGELR